MTPLFTSALLRTQSDERLVRLVREGNELAFEAIVDRYRRSLQRYCERALPASRAEDVVQQVLTKAWCALREGTDVRSLRPWLYRIAATTVFETARAPRYDYEELRRSLQAPAGPEAELEQQAVIRRTLAALAALPSAQREALLRDAFEGQSRAQIAEALGVTEGAVRQLLHRARGSLRTAATAVTPLPFLSWLTTTASAPAAGGAVEGGAAGAFGAFGISGIAKVSAVMATAGVVATGSAGVHNARADKPRKPKARATTQAALRHPVVKVSRVAPVALRERAPQAQPSDHRDSGRQDDAQPGQENGDFTSGGREGSDQSEQRSEPAQGEADQPPPEEHAQAPQQHEGDGGGGGDASGPDQPDSGDGAD